MQFTFRIVHFLLFVNLTADISWTQPSISTTSPASYSEKADKVFRRWDRNDGPGAAVIVIKNGTIVYKKGYGLSNLEHRVPVSTSTVFEVASLSKQFTAFAILSLAKERKISLDDDVRKFVPELPNYGKTITIRNLLNHTSGLRDWISMLTAAGYRIDDVITHRQIMKMVVSQRRLNHAPGEKYAYTNSGYTLLAEIFKRVSGTSLSEWTSNNVFKPLGMNATGFHDDHRTVVKNRAYAYRRGPSGDYVHTFDNAAVAGPISLFSTAEDLSKWLLNFENPRVGDRELLDQMAERGVLNNGKKINYAAGLTNFDYRGLKLVGHTGIWASFRTVVLRVPEKRFGVVILSNDASFNSIRTAIEMAKIYLGDSMQSSKKQAGRGPVRGATQSGTTRTDPGDVIAKHGEEYQGRYFSDELESFYEIKINSGKLVAVHRRLPSIPLRLVSKDNFRGNSAFFFRQVRFVRDPNGRVNGFLLSGGRFADLLFKKRWERKGESRIK